MSVSYCSSSVTKNLKLILAQSLASGPHQCLIVGACRFPLTSGIILTITVKFRKEAKLFIKCPRLFPSVSS